MMLCSEDRDFVESLQRRLGGKVAYCLLIENPTPRQRKAVEIINKIAKELEHSSPVLKSYVRSWIGMALSGNLPPLPEGFLPDHVLELLKELEEVAKSDYLFRR